MPPISSAHLKAPFLPLRTPLGRAIARLACRIRTKNSSSSSPQPQYLLLIPSTSWWSSSREASRGAELSPFVTALTNTIAANRSLQTLSVSGNKLGDRAGKAIASALLGVGANTTITVLSVEQNDFERATKAAIIDAACSTCTVLGADAGVGCSIQ